MGEAFLRSRMDNLPIPGAYPDEHPILAIWGEGGNLHGFWSAWTVHYGHKDGSLLLRHVKGFRPPFKTRECDLSATTFAGIIEDLQLVSIPLASQPLSMMTEATHSGVMYENVRLRWYGCIPEGWEGLEHWCNATVRIFEQAMQEQT